jgi:hypothetical protein
VIEIRNLQFQPLTFQLGTDGSLHLGPRQKKSIAKKDLSAEIQTAAKRGLVRITDLSTSGAPAQDESASSKETADSESKSTQAKRRK